MSYPHSITRALATVGRHKALLLIQLAGNAALGAAAYGWLLIPEAAVWQVVASAILAVTLLCAFLLLHGGTVRYFGEAVAESAIWSAFAGTVRRLPALLIWSVILVAGRELLYLADEEGWAVVIASWLTLNLKRPIAPPDVAAWLLRLQTALDWFWLAVWLVFGREIVHRGFSAFRAGWQAWWGTASSRGYWLAVILLWLAGVWLPGLLVSWVPQVGSLWMEFASLAMRFLPATALALLCWLTLLALVAQPVAPSKD